MTGRYDFSGQRGRYTATRRLHRHRADANASGRLHAGGERLLRVHRVRRELHRFALRGSELRARERVGALRDEERKWATTLFVNNLTDEVYANNAQAFGRGFWTVGGPTGVVGPFAAPRNAIADYRARPREDGLTFQFNFH